MTGTLAIGCATLARPSLPACQLLSAAPSLSSRLGVLVGVIDMGEPVYGYGSYGCSSFFSEMRRFKQLLAVSNKAW
jgi:hypothetical protein